MADTFGKSLKNWRANAGLSLRELSPRVELSASFLSEIESGAKFPTNRRMKILFRALKIPQPNRRHMEKLLWQEKRDRWTAR